jgi:NAD(P)-dependent dehydrogenase (short-subunit alcohol dehydrogenase family)
MSETPAADRRLAGDHRDTWAGRDGPAIGTVLVTDATQYAGPGAVAALVKAGARVVCHDPCFADAAARQAFALAHPAVTVAESAGAAALVAELARLGIDVDAAVLNSAFANRPTPVGEIPLDDFRRTFEAVFLFPVDLAQLLLPAMRRRRAGALVFVTSARQLQPEPGFAVATAIRAATTTFAQALAREVASDGIQVNAVAPNYLYSEMYYPRARFIDDAEGRARIAALVPAGRLGMPEEIGELITFLVAGKARFVTGQTIFFTGGWP